MNQNTPERSIVVVGVGLIGGSIAAAVRKRFPKCAVAGIGRNRDRLQRAQDIGLLTAWSNEISPASIPQGSLGIVCLPVHQIADGVRQLRNAGCELITDAGSVKASIYEALSSDADHRFVGSHPIAGSEQSGFEYADADLFANRLCIVTTTTPEHAADKNLQRVVAFWRGLEAAVYLMSPEEHDRVLALTSHLPHILASVAAGCVDTDLLAFTGTGYRDTTRIAAGSGSLWASILLGNAKHCLDAIRTAEDLLQKHREALMAGDAKSLQDLWEFSARRRRMLNRDAKEAT